jgi:hypothetical protein
VIKENTVAGFHRAQIVPRREIPHARPCRFAVLHQLRPRVSFGFGFHEPVIHAKKLTKSRARTKQIKNRRFTFLCSVANLHAAANLEKIQQRIKAACDRCGPRTGFSHAAGGFQNASAGTIRAAADRGLLFFGENKIQEAKAKIPLCPGKLRWHFIGHLQSNKCRDAVELFEMIQSVDSSAARAGNFQTLRQAAKQCRFCWR